MDSRLTSLRFAALSSHLKLKEAVVMGGRPLFPDAPEDFKWLHRVLKHSDFCIALTIKPSQAKLSLVLI